MPARRSKPSAPKPPSKRAAKIAVIGDIHSNLTALRAVLAECARRRIARFFCVGDIVGYGPRPGECVEIVRSLQCPTVMGNHDLWAARGEPDFDISPLAQQAILYSIRELSTADRAWLADLPFVEIAGAATIVHASLATPSAFDYITNAMEAKPSVELQTTTVCFNGHTHVPHLFASAKLPNPEIVGEYKFLLPPGGRYLINGGSVGQPRSGDPRAQFVIYDPAKSTIEFAAVKYDIEAEIAAFRDAGLPAELGTRLRYGM